MASLLGKPPSLQRPSSKSASTSSSSVVTVQRVTSPPTRNGTRPLASTLRSQSPTLVTISTTSSRRPLTPEPQRRTGSGHSRRSSIGGISEGMGNLNRWSQSTASSKTSGVAHNRKNSFARRLSGSFGAFGGFAASQSSPVKQNIEQKITQSPGISPERTRARPRTPPVQAARRLPTATYSTSSPKKLDPLKTPSTSTTATPATVELLAPSEHVPGFSDYFGDKWTEKSPKRQRGNGETMAVPSVSRAPPGSVRTTGASKSYNNQTSHGTSSPHRSSSHTQRKERDPHSRSKHSRNGERATKENGASDGDRSGSGVPRDSERSARRRAHSQKAMLSRALQKAKHAVLLDNAQNYEGAVEAYGDACKLLQQVMLRSSGDGDRQKLETIRVTYSSRIVDLQTNELQSRSVADKALPEVPRNAEAREDEPFSPTTDGDDDDDGDRVTAIHTVPVTQSEFQQTRVASRTVPRSLNREQLPPRRASLMPFGGRENGATTPTINADEQDDPLDSWSIDSPQDSIVETTMRLAPPMVKEYMPPPLSPRRPLSPVPPEKLQPTTAHTVTAQQHETRQFQHSRQETAESTSWLDTIDESGGSSASSVHSRSSSIGLRRKHIRAPSGNTEAEFDAALDAAVEAAYDDGFEPVVEHEHTEIDLTHNTFNAGQVNYISDARRNVDLAKQRVREAEREAAIAAAKEQQMKRRWDQPKRNRSESVNAEYEPDEAEEEERILEEMTRDYVMDDTEYDVQSKSALPRQSDSSGFSGRTWGSSIGSNPTTAGTTLSSVAEIVSVPTLPLQTVPKVPPPPSHPPPSGALPPPPQAISPSTNGNSTQTSNAAQTRPAKLAIITTPGVRERRLSGQKAKQLMIDTTTKLPNGMTAPKTQPPSVLPPIIAPQAVSEPPKSASLVEEPNWGVTSATLQPNILPGSAREAPSPFLAPSPMDTVSGISPATPASSILPISAKGEEAPQIPASPTRAAGRSPAPPGILKKNFSSSSLRSLKPSTTAPNIPEELPSTPISRVFSSTSQVRHGPTPAVPDIPTPMAANFSPAGLSTGGISFLDSDIHSPLSSGPPHKSTHNAPLPLESCPESFLLRPFWLLRCIYHSIAHPRGAYISTRLFVPRDIWRVKNVKLKGVDEKVSNCDMLTAALLKLAKVDMLDADAVLEEMQAFEIVLDQIQALLTKKLGSEVGVQGSAYLFKGSPTGDDVGEGLGTRSTSAGGKSYLSSWRKLRSKTSAAQGAPVAMAGMAGKENARETLTMKSLPMTASMNPRFPKRDVAKVVGVGPHAHYMTALARLCDAVQVLDQIARQVEDPGLKHSSQTHVGLELSTRHAAEFFGFFVCRFVLADIGLMLDKFVKRGSEWVLA